MKYKMVLLALQTKAIVKKKKNINMFKPTLGIAKKLFLEYSFKFFCSQKAFYRSYKTHTF